MATESANQGDPLMLSTPKSLTRLQPAIQPPLTGESVGDGHGPNAAEVVVHDRDPPHLCLQHVYHEHQLAPLRSAPLSHANAPHVWLQRCGSSDHAYSYMYTPMYAHTSV